MKITEKRLTISRTFNLGNYENIKFEAGATASVESGDLPHRVEAALILECREQIKSARAAYSKKKETAS